MPLKQDVFKSFDGVPAATTGVTTVACKLPLGRRIYDATLVVGDAAGTGIGTLAAPTLIGAVRLMINGKAQRELSAQRIAMLNALMNDPGGSEYTAKTYGTATDGFGAPARTMLPLFFAELWRRGSTPNGVPESYLTAVNLNGIESAGLEVDFLSGITTPYITGFYNYEDTNLAIGNLVKITEHNLGAIATPADLDGLDFGGQKRGDLLSLHFLPGTDGASYVKSLDVKVGSEQYRKNHNRAWNDFDLIKHKMNPTALDTTSAMTVKNTGAFHLVMDFDDPFRNRLGVAEKTSIDIQATLNQAATSNHIVIAQTYGPPD